MNDSFWPDPRSRPRPAAPPEKVDPDAPGDSVPLVREDSTPAAPDNAVPAVSEEFLSATPENSASVSAGQVNSVADTPSEISLPMIPATEIPLSESPVTEVSPEDVKPSAIEPVWPPPVIEVDYGPEYDDDSPFDFDSWTPILDGVLQEDDGYPLEWLWENRFPRGQLVLLSGVRGVGKTFLVCDWVARITRGAAWPGETEQTRTPGRVLFIGPTPRVLIQILPRLRAAGADLAKIDFYNKMHQPPRWNTGVRSVWRLAEQEEAFCELLNREEPYELIVVETLEEFTDTEISAAARTQELEELELLLQGHATTLLCVTTSARIDRGGWAWEREPAFSTVWGVARDPFVEEKRLLLPIHTTFGPELAGLSFQIAAEGGEGRVVWSDAPETIRYAELTGRGAHASARRGGSSVATQTALAEIWLRSFLRAGAQPSVTILREGAALGLSRQPIHTALGRVGVKHKQGNGGGWSWSLHENVQNSRETR